MSVASRSATRRSRSSGRMANRWWCGPTRWRQGKPGSQPRLGTSGNKGKKIIQVRVTGAAGHRRRGDRVNTRVAAPAHDSNWHFSDSRDVRLESAKYGQSGRVEIWFEGLAR